MPYTSTQVRHAGHPLNPMRRSPLRLVPAAVTALPWAWFLVRDVDARLDAVALLWPVFGTLAVVVLGLAAALARRRRPVVAAGSWLVVLLLVVLGPWRPLGGGTPAPPMRVVEANTFGDNTQVAAIVADVGAQRPDVLVISEVSDALDLALRDRFPAAVRSIEPNGKPGDVAVYSRYPLQPLPLPRVVADQRGARVVVTSPAGPLVLFAMHLQKPGIDPSSVEVGFRTHRRIVDRLVAAVAAERRPVIVAGDLNLSDRTSGYRTLMGVLDDGARAGWAGPTSLRRTTRPLLARIDHVLMPEGWCSRASRRFTLHGSDHHGVATTIGPCR